MVQENSPTKPSQEEQEQEAKEEVGGELLFCGAYDFNSRSRKPGQFCKILTPTRLSPLVGINIRCVAAGAASEHCVAVAADGRCFTWGRNHKGQLGHGDSEFRPMPTLVSALSHLRIVKAASGMAHTIVVTDSGKSLGFGWNKYGQLGIGSAKPEIVPLPKHCVGVLDVTEVACGSEFSVWLISLKGASIFTAGLGQYGQLGHGTDYEHNSSALVVKLDYYPQPTPLAIELFSERNVNIVKVACGTNHTIAVDSEGFVYSWGRGDYGCLGHRVQKDEWRPMRVDVFTRSNVLPADAVVAAGGVFSACSSQMGQLYIWGKWKSGNMSESNMYPKSFHELNGWQIRCIDFGLEHCLVGAEDSCIGWGFASFGQLGFGPLQKSSGNPKKLDSLEGMKVLDVACGLAHSLIVVERKKFEERIEQMGIFDGESCTVPECLQTKKLVTTPLKRKGAPDSEKGEDGSPVKKVKKSKLDEENSKDDGDVEETSSPATEGKGRGTGRGTGGGRGRGGSIENGPAGRGRGRGRVRGKGKGRGGSTENRSGGRGRGSAQNRSTGEGKKGKGKGKNR